MIDTAYSNSSGRRVSEADEELLLEIRERYKRWDEAWQKIREERDTDMRYICGDPWEPEDRNARRDAGRPCISHDELGQYIFQTVNNVRQNKRGIKADPRGYGSSEQSAQLRQDIIRTIEYDCDGPSVYAEAFQQMVEGSYAFFRISRRYVSDRYAEEPEPTTAMVPYGAPPPPATPGPMPGAPPPPATPGPVPGGSPIPQGGPPLPPGGPGGLAGPPQSQYGPQTKNRSLFQQEICLKPIRNPNSVLFDPNCKEPDWSDARGCYHLERFPRKEFKRRWPNAQVTDFSWEQTLAAGEWINDDDVLVAEYWRIEMKDRTVYLLDDGTVVDHLPAGTKAFKKRTLQIKTVMQYITNGVEILERSDDPEPGSILPIIPMIGLQRWVNDMGKTKMKLFSLIRLARDPQMSLAYLVSQEMEEAGLSPKSPWMGYKGQFDSNRDMWLNCTKQAYAFLETDVPDNWPPGQIPPLPQRVPFTPNFQAYEVAKESCRRAVQAAMGVSPLPTPVQRANEKSGIALERLENMQATGSYHFIDGYDRALRLAGRVIDQWIPAVYDEPRRPLQIRKPDDTYRLIQLNSEPYPDEKNPGQYVQYPVEEVDHAIAVSSGPSYSSQREQVASFIDMLITNLPNMPWIPPPVAAQILSIAIKMKNLGPQGDQLAEIISPSPGSPDQSMAQMQQAQAQLQQQGVLLQQLQQELQKLQFEKQSKLIDRHFDLAVEKMKAEGQLAVAEINTKSQEIKERERILADTMSQIHSANQEAGTQGREHAHEKHLAAQELMHDAFQQAMEQEHERQQTAVAAQASTAQPEAGNE